MSSTYYDNTIVEIVAVLFTSMLGNLWVDPSDRYIIFVMNIALNSSLVPPKPLKEGVGMQDPNQTKSEFWIKAMPRRWGFSDNTFMGWEYLC